MVGQTRFFSLGEATSLGEGKSSEFKPVKLRLKIDPCGFILPERRGLGKYGLFNIRYYKCCNFVRVF